MELYRGRFWKISKIGNKTSGTMQDIHPDVVTPEQLVNEILRRQSNRSPLPNAVTPPGCSGEEDVGGRRCSVTKAMSVEDEEDLTQALSQASEVVILDCQSPCDFQECHIRGALNVTFPAIMIRRIAAGKIDIFEKSRELKAKITNAKITFVVYDNFHRDDGIKEGENLQEFSDLVNLIAKKLAQNGCHVATLRGIVIFK